MPLTLLPLLLSEVLANEPGSATSLEFVELAARQPVQEGFLIFDANGKTVAVPVVPLDSGDFLVLCRDAARFEQHFGDSSGSWGDHDAEDYPLQEFALSLPNGEGYVALTQGSVVDRFDWSGDAPDGASYERVSDSAWQVTESVQGSTPGRRNHGATPDFDWSIEAVEVYPVIPKSGTQAQVTVRIRNLGANPRAGSLCIVHLPGDTLLIQSYAGSPGEQVEVLTHLVPTSGRNVIGVSLSGDDREANNFAELVIYADASPLVLSEVYPAPAVTQPEWLEVYAPGGFDTALAAVSVADLTDTALIAPDGWAGDAHTYAVFTEDSALFALAFPGLSVPVVQLDRWPSLNNDGDTVVLMLQGTRVDRVGFPSVGSRRGVAFERVGTTDAWGWSVAPQGSTPGSTNSIDVNYSFAIEVEVSPNPFAAGLGESAQFHYQVPFGAEGELRLFRGDGRLVRTLFERRPVVSGEVAWDGANDQGALVPVGIYVVQFRLYRPQERVHLSTVVVAR